MSHLYAYSIYTYQRNRGSGWALTVDLSSTTTIWRHQVKLIGAVWKQAKSCDSSLSQWLNCRSSCKGISWMAKVYMGSRGEKSVNERHSY